MFELVDSDFELQDEAEENCALIASLVSLRAVSNTALKGAACPRVSEDHDNERTFLQHVEAGKGHYRLVSQPYVSVLLAKSCRIFPQAEEGKAEKERSYKAIRAKQVAGDLSFNEAMERIGLPTEKAQKIPVIPDAIRPPVPNEPGFLSAVMEELNGPLTEVGPQKVRCAV